MLEKDNKLVMLPAYFRKIMQITQLVDVRRVKFKNSSGVWYLSRLRDIYLTVLYVDIAYW